MYILWNSYAAVVEDTNTCSAQDQDLILAQGDLLVLCNSRRKSCCCNRVTCPCLLAQHHPLLVEPHSSCYTTKRSGCMEMWFYC